MPESETKTVSIKTAVRRLKEVGEYDLRGVFEANTLAPEALEKKLRLFCRRCRLYMNIHGGICCEGMRVKRRRGELQLSVSQDGSTPESWKACPFEPR